MKEPASADRAHRVLLEARDQLLGSRSWRLTADDPVSPIGELITCPLFQWWSQRTLPMPAPTALMMRDYPWLAELKLDEAEVMWELRLDGDLYANAVTVFDLGLGSAPIGHLDLQRVLQGRVVRWGRESTLPQPRGDWSAAVKSTFPPHDDDRAVIVDEDDDFISMRVVSDAEVLWQPPSTDAVFVIAKVQTGPRLVEVRDVDGRVLSHVERGDDTPTSPVDLAAMDVIEADELLDLLRAAYPQIRPRLPRRRKGRATLHLIEPDHPGDWWSLTSYDLSELIRSPDAASLDRAISAVLHRQDEDLADAIDLDSEGGMFCARARQGQPLRQLAALIRAHLLTDTEVPQ